MNSRFDARPHPLPRLLLGWLLLTQLGSALCLLPWAALVGLAIRAARVGDTGIPFPLAGLAVIGAAFPICALGCSAVAWRLARAGFRALPAVLTPLPLVPALVYLGWMRFVAE